jgi:hypothetical protein
VRQNAHVYVMEAEDGTVKVGHSNNPERRLRQISGATGLRLAHKTPSLTEAERVERMAHRLLTLNGQKIRAEWFSASVMEAMEAIERAMAIVDGNVEPPPKPPPVRKVPARVIVKVEFDERKLSVIDQVIKERYGQATVRDILREALAAGLDVLEGRKRK